MVKVSTLFHRVDGFDFSDDISARNPNITDQDLEDYFLNKLLEPLVFDPGDELVRRILQQT